MRGPHLGIRIDLPGLGSRSPGPDDQSQTEKSSGSVNRSSYPDSVRHMSVTIATQGLTAAHRETRRDSSKAAREPGYAQANGPFPQVVAGVGFEPT